MEPNDISGDDGVETESEQENLVYEEIPGQKQTLQREALRTDDFLKKFLLRDFRRIIKETYNHAFGKSRNYLCEASNMANLKKFFTGKVWEEQEGLPAEYKDLSVIFVPEDVYERNKEVFFRLIFNTKKDFQKYNLVETDFTR